MRVLLDTNIIISRESVKVTHEGIGLLFKWLDDLKHVKCIHPVTVQEINKLKQEELRHLMNIKLRSYSLIQVHAPIHPNVSRACDPLDYNMKDKNDTVLVNELYIQRVDCLITEDRKIAKKAGILGISDRVFTIDAFLEKMTSENPQLADYKVLSVRKNFFGHIDLKDRFFDSFRDDYPGFDAWFNRKSEETAYLCEESDNISAFLYLKVEGKNEPYADIIPPFSPKKRLKIGTFKVVLNGYKLGERFIKIVFDNALRFEVEEIYVTIFDKQIEQQRLIKLLEDYGFSHYGTKQGVGGIEQVYTRNMKKAFDAATPRLTYPYFSRNSQKYIVPIYPKYHTQLFPDSILRTESPTNFTENEPFRNAISKVYISRSYFRALHPGDIIVFYRTGGYYQGVATTIGIVENVITNIKNQDHFISLCRQRSVFSDEELRKHWNYNSQNRPFIVNFLYVYSFPKRPNLKKLIDIGVITSVQSVPRGFEQINNEAFERLLVEAGVDARIIVD